MIKELLNQRNLPPLQPRQRMLEVLQREVYGFVPPNPEELRFFLQENIIPDFCDGKACFHKITAAGSVQGREFSFPFFAAMPKKQEKVPVIIHINFHDCLTDRETPFHHLVESGFAVLSVFYQDVTKDNDDFRDGIAAAFFPEGTRDANAPGKIALWAWAAQRMMDYAQTCQDVLDLDTTVLCGHSRLGKTALLAGAVDSRFTVVYSNESGCSGAAITRGKQGERIRQITEKFPYWFCENYRKYADREQTIPFDQHFLLASIAPRYLLVGSAAEDIWADPESEFLCCLAASGEFAVGLQCADREIQTGDCWFAGDIGYHLRGGEHDFSLTDWERLLAFVREKGKRKES